MALFTYFGALLPRDIAARNCGRVFLEGLLEAAPEWAPETYNYFEPVNVTFDPEDLETALAAWQSNFFWRRKRPTIQGSAWSGGGWVHSAVYIRVSQTSFSSAVAARLLAKLIRTFGVDLAYVHVAHDDDFKDRARYQTHTMPFVEGVTTHDLRGGLPDLAWATFFGPSYVELFDREHLLRTPVARAEDFEGGVYLQLTPDPTDALKARDVHLQLQDAGRKHLNKGAFVGGMSGGSPRVPHFRLG